MNTMKYHNDSIWDTKDHSHSNWSIAAGILLIITGIVAILMPVVAALASIAIFAWLLIIAGAFEIVHSIQMRNNKNFMWMFVSGLLTFLFGMVVWLSPFAGAVSLSILVGGFLFIGGVTRLLLAINLRSHSNWGWIMLDGILSLSLAFLMITNWPQGSLAIIGMLAGFVLVSSGIWRIMIANIDETSYNVLYDARK